MTYNHDVVIKKDFKGDKDAYLRHMQSEATELRAAFLSTLEIAGRKAQATRATPRVTQAMVAAMTKEDKDIDKAFNKVQDLLLQVADYDSPHEKDYRAKLQGFRDQYTVVKKEVALALTDAEGRLAEDEANPVPAAANGGAAAGPATAPAPTTAADYKTLLKPFILSATAAPTELEEWERRFGVFFNAINAKDSANDVKHALFLSFVDATICKKLKRKIEMDMPIFTNAVDADATVMNLLREEFIAMHPSLSRQLSLFKMGQSKGQRMSDFYYSWEDNLLNANLEDINFDKLSIILLMHATADTELVKEFQKKAKTATQRKDLLEIIIEYEAHDRDRSYLAKARDGPAAHVALAGRGKPISNINSFFQNLKKEGRCYRCLEKLTDGHVDICKGKNAKCTACNRTGHLTSACGSKHATRGASAAAAAASETTTGAGAA